jgi:hypothetical protein
MPAIAALGLAISVLTVSVLPISVDGAFAQTVGPDEAVNPNGAVGQALVLTAAQKNAIYNAVIRQRVKISTPDVPTAIGAAVPPSAALGDLPDQAVVGDVSTTLLKYAMVEDDLVVVDPIKMCVVDVIHSGVKP